MRWSAEEELSADFVLAVPAHSVTKAQTKAEQTTTRHGKNIESKAPFTSPYVSDSEDG